MDGSTTISPAKSQPAVTDNLSARDHLFGGKDTNNSSHTEKSVEEKSEGAEREGGDENGNAKKGDAASEVKEKIDDVGEKIGGARKDIAQAAADRINIHGETFAKIFPKFDYKKLIEKGLNPKQAAGLKFVSEHTKMVFKANKKRRGENYALSAARFMANYAKGFLLGDTSVDYSNNGWVFTAYGKRVFELNTEIYGRLYDALGGSIFDVDLSEFSVDVVLNKSEREESGKNYNGDVSYFRDGKEIDARYIVHAGHGRSKVFTEEEREDAINDLIGKVKESINYDKAHPYKLSVYYTPGKQNSYYIGAKIGGKVVAITEHGSQYGVKYVNEHNAELQAMAQRKAEEMKAERKNAPKVAEIKEYTVWDATDQTHKSYWGVKIGNEVIPVSDAFVRNVVDSKAYREYRDKMDAAKADAQKKAQELVDEHEADKGWKPELNLGNLRSRVGVDYRNGRNVSADELRETFGLRGVEFGNYVSQKERQKYINECYDAMMDLAGLLGINPKAVSLNGKLGLAIGARGKGGASAHYEPEKNVINLTKKNGAGALAHEWWHAIDHYFGNKKSMKPATSLAFDENARKDVRDAIAKLAEVIGVSEYRKRSVKLDGKIGGDYFATDTELGARAFQDYVTKKLIERAQVNDFLSHHTDAEGWNGKAETYPYPTGEEAERIAEAFENVFNTIQERTDESGNQVLFQQGASAAPIVKMSEEAQKVVTDTVDKMLAGAGIETVRVSQEEGQRRAAENDAEFMKKKRALETASLADNEQDHPTVVSSADGAKILNNLGSLKKELENKANRSKTFLGSLAKDLGAKQDGSKSQYATFETLNGNIVTIRLADHNASVSTFDNHGEFDGISIVVSAKKNEKITNDGQAHVVEYYYDAIKLRKAGGKPLVSIVESIEQALRSGEYKDNTGLAERDEVNEETVREFMQTGEGSVYGWAEGDKIYLTPEGLNGETKVHEYTHLWCKAVQSKNPELWGSVKEVMQQTPVWQEVLADKAYASIHDDEDAVCSEVVSRLSGRKNAQKMADMAQQMIDETKKEGMIETAKAYNLIERIKKALSDLWNWIGVNLFDMKSVKSADEVTDRVLWDLANGTELGVEKGGKAEFEKAAEEDSGVHGKKFKEWFGDWEKDPEHASKVVDKNGDPLVMVHNTDNDFWTFDKDRIGTGQGEARLGVGFNFSRGGGSIYGKNTMQVYLDIKHPLSSNNITLTRQQIRSIVAELDRRSGENIERSWGNMKDYLDSLLEYSEGDLDICATLGMEYAGDKKDVIEVFEKYGYDGTIEYDDGGKIRNAVAFEPTQIKSATDNNGEYDPSNPDIRYHKSEAGANAVSEEEAAIREAVADMMREARIEAIGDATEGQRVLNEARREEVRMMSVRDNISNGISALEKIADGAESVEGAMQRSDLRMYGGNSDVTFYYGKTGNPENDYKGGYGIAHIGAKHGTEAIAKAVKIIATGDIERYVEGNKTVILTDGEYEVVLALTRFGNKETWLFNGWKKKGNADENGEVSTASASTQTNPTFSRDDLGAAISSAKVQRNSDFSIKNDAQNPNSLKMQKENLEQPVFYSNAKRAVEGIKQEKATPEQWLAMIQKAGGLKARRRRAKRASGCSESRVRML